MNLINKINDRKSLVCVIGLGYVGLPLIKTFLNTGFQVIGFDIDKKKVELLNKGRSYIKHVTGKDLIPYVEKNKFKATTDPKALAKADVILICVPTPLDAHKNPDLSFVLNTTKLIANNRKKGQLVVLESTTYPGTTEDEMLPILETKGYKVGRDFYLAYSPERENPGDAVYTTANIPKVVGGVTRECLKAAKTLYDQIVIQTVPVSSTQVAEATKLLENIFRSVNIALVNEIKMIFDRMGIDVWEVIKASSTKPFGFMPFSPGPGYGGHCIPVDPFYLTWKAKEFDFPTRFIELAGEINTFMPYFVVDRTIEELNERGRVIKGARVLILGIAYKKDVDDQRESPSLKIITLLKQRGAKVDYNDPHVPRSSGHRDYPDLSMKSVKLDQTTLKKYDVAIITTGHTAYDYDWIVKHSHLVIDTRNAIKKKRKNVVKA